MNLEAEPQACTPTVLDVDERSTYVNVGQSYVLQSADGVLQHFAYGDGSTSSLGVGYSPTDSNFTADGTISVSSTGEVSFPYEGVGYIHWETPFEVGLFIEACTGVDYYFVWPYAWDGGSFVNYVAGKPRTPHCEFYSAGRGSGVTVKTSAATQFSVGYNSPLGFSGTGQTGYTTLANISLSFVSEGALGCGADNFLVRTDPGPGEALATNG